MANSDYEKRGSGQFALVATLKQNISYFDNVLELVDAVYDSGPDEDLAVGMSIMLNEEIMRVDEIIEVDGDTLTVRVGRGCADTRPWEHPGGSDVWFFDDATGTDGRIYAGGEQAGVKVLPWTHSGGVMPVEQSPPLPLTFNWRYSRPYVPGLARHSVPAMPWFEEARFSYDDGGMHVSWTHRDRLLQADQLIDHFQGNIGPEPGVTCKVRVFNDGNDLLRTEVGISGNQWTYPWAQAMGDFGLTVGSNREVGGFLELCAYRDGLDSWQYYRMPFKLVADGPQMLVAMFGEQIVQPQPVDETDRHPLTRAVNVAMYGEQVMQPSGNDGAQDGGLPVGVMVAMLQEDVGTGDSVFAPMNRIWFEAPYTFLIRRFGLAPFSARIVSGVARTSDRLTDAHSIWSRLRDDSTAEFAKKGEPPWCAWATTASPLDYLQEDVAISKTSLADGVDLDEVRPGMLALIGGEIVIVRSIDQVAKRMTVGRGSVDTVPSPHAAGSRIWFFEAGCGVDDGPFPDPADNDARVGVDLKAVPKGYGGYEIPPSKAPTDFLRLSLRKQRPFPPGRLLVNGMPWFNGGTAEPGKSLVFTFTQRNRLTLRANAVDHHHDSIPHEPGTTYVFSIVAYYTPVSGTSQLIRIREDRVIGERYEYTWEMAVRDGYRLAALYDYCGRVSTNIKIDAERDGLLNWQGYSVRVVLPAPACPPGKYPGGNVPLPPGPGPGGGAGGNNGNGSNNDSPGDGGTNQPPRDEDPFNNGSGDNGDTGNPGGHEPPGEDDKYWDYRWDIFYAARKRGEDDIGE